MEKLKKKRAARRGWVTRTAQELSAMLTQPSPSISELEAVIQEFNKRLAKLDEVQEELEEEVEVEELDQELDEAYAFKQEGMKARVQAEDKIRELAVAAAPAGFPAPSIVSGSQNSEAVNVKLPKLELPKFSGEVTQWQSFWDQFNSHIDATNLPVISKFTYLLSLLEGDAKSVVKGLAHTSDNYQVARDLLKDRYGKPERIIFAHVQALLCGHVNLTQSGTKSVAQLWKLRDEILTHIRSLEALGVSGKQCEVFLTPIILSRLPNELRLEWARDGDGHESDLEWLLQFLHKEISRLERSEAFKGKKATSEEKKFESKGSKEKVYSAAALHASSKQDGVLCSFCGKKHKSENCYAVLNLDGKERGEKIKGLGLCFKCLKGGHMSRECKAHIKCTRCNGMHNVLMCGVKLDLSLKKEEDKESKSGDTSAKPENVVLLSGQGSNCTILQTAKVQVSTGDGDIVVAKVMFDNGADRTYVSSNFVKRCKPKWITSTPILYSSFGGHSVGKNEQRNVYRLQLWDSERKSVPIIAAEIPKICQPLVRPVVPSAVLNSFSHVALADGYQQDSPLEIDILIGLDFYWTMISPAEAVQMSSVVAMKSVFGYVLSGKISECIPTSSEYSTPQMLCISSVSDADLRRFWDLETVGVKPKEVVESYSDTRVHKEFESTVQFVDDRYEVTLPWKDEFAKERLMNNEGSARKRLSKLMIKLDKDKELKKEYQKVFDSYESDLIVEEVPSEEISGVSPVYYMPHRPVVKLSSTSTKVRPVFDASATGYNGVSLNDCLLSGPSLNPDLVEVLIRFRRWPFALTADIAKAFLQVTVQRNDRDVHRFLLPREDGTVRHMRFTRVPFGNTASPFLLNATIKHHLNKYPETSVVQELKSEMYTDNWLSGADSVVEASEKFCEARSILADASMDLTKLVSNSLLITSKSHDQYFISGDEPNTVLGLKWCNSQDTFSFVGINPNTSVEVASTKRSILSVIAKIFDPLGLISPFVMYGKILFQELWKLNVSWDEEMPSDLKVRFQKWLLSSQSLKSFHVNRCYFPGLSWGELRNVELHGFGDASEKGYGACVYLRVTSEDNVSRVSLVASKSRVAPIKSVTLPRLELMGALLCSRLVDFVKTSLKLDSDTQVVCWTDSTIALSWIQGETCKKDVFVFNRVRDILALTPQHCWQHCRGKDNPADLITRGLLADKLVDNSMWLCGPSMLKDNPRHPKQSSTVASDTKKASNKSTVCLNVQGEPVSPCMDLNKHSDPCMDLNKHSDLNKALRVTAYVLRFINNCRSQNELKGSITTEEIDLAKCKLIYLTQREVFSDEIKALLIKKAIPKKSKLSKLDPFIDDQGLLRIKGRLEFSDLDYDTKHPVIIPRGPLAKLLIRFQHKLLKHAGVGTVISSLRTNFWIIGVRRLAKTVVKECFSCRCFDTRPCSQPVAPLPKERVTSAPPFSVTGLDFAGPLFCADYPSNKFYVLLFTCGVTRAIHLELTESLSLSDCLLAIRRFVARRGLPSIMYSDNAKTFIAAQTEVQKVYGHLAPKWKYIVPRSPWWGGWWERLIRSVKLALRKTLNHNYVSKTELETILVEIESSINTRPLTYVSEYPDSSQYLTPSHFLLGRVPHSKPSQEVEPSIVSSKDLTERECVKNQRLEHFWKVWSNNYITNLPQVVKGFTQNCSLSKGDLVLIKEDNIPRLKWPLGLVTDVFPGKDGFVRSVKLRTSKGEITRSIQRLYNLEVPRSEEMDVSGRLMPYKVSDDNENSCDDEASLPVDSVSDPDVPSQTRSGRVIKVPVKLDL